MSFSQQILFQKPKAEETIKILRSKKKPILIYGAGTYTYVVSNYLNKSGLNVFAYCVDREYINHDTYLGKPLIPIEELIPNANKYSFVNGIAPYQKVLNKLNEKGIEEYFVIDVPDFLNIPKPFLDKHFLEDHISELEQAYELFEDDLSKKTFVASINARLNQNPDFLESVLSPDHLYFCQNELAIEDDELILDVGGFNGDSIRDLVSIKERSFHRVISLEPFEKNFRLLEQTVQELNISNKTTLINKGAWDEKGTLKFSNTKEDIDSKVDEDGSLTIDVDTIDHILEELNEFPTLIKMDINGAEFRALKGMMSTVCSLKPKIAIKLHVKEDYYRFPLLIKKIVPSAKIYLRQRNSMSMMLMFYVRFE